MILLQWKKKLEKKLQEEVICSHVCNFMIHDLIVIADVAQFFFFAIPSVYCCCNAANSLNLAVRQSRKTIIWKKEQVGDARLATQIGVCFGFNAYELHQF